MAHIVENIVFGLDWRTVISDNKEEIRRLAAESSANAYCEVKWDGNVRAGFGTFKRTEKLRSAAAVLSEKLEGGNGIFVHQFSADLACCVVIRDHLPVEGHDVVGSPAIVAETVRKYLDSRPKEEIQQKIYGGMVEHFSTVQRFPLDRITSAADEIHALKRLQSPKNKIAVAVGLAVLVIGTYYSGDLLDVFQPQKKAPPPDQAAIYHDQVIAAMNTIVQAREFPSIVMDGFLPFVEKMPAEIAGWKLQTIVCNGTDCIATWKRNQGATTRGFFEAFKVPENDTSISFNSIDTISRAVSFTKKADEKKLVLGTRNQFGQAIVSWFQQLSDEKLQPTINEQQPLVPGAPPNANPKDKLMVGSYSFTVPYAALDQVKKLPDLMTIQKITLTYKERGDVKVEFTGKFYAI